MTGSRIGDQLTLPGFEAVVVGASKLPWGGRSPRALTRGYKRFILKPRAKKSVSDFVSDENQYDLWLPVKKAPFVYDGAPSLLPLDHRE